MEIKSLFKSKSKAPPPEYFLAVEIHDSLLKTAVWQVEEEKASVVSVGTFEAWEDIDSLVNGLDASLTQAVKGLGVEPDRVIFGLPESWLDGDKLDAQRAHLIKKVVKELSLKPIGLVTITEAILQQLKSDEGIPATAILLEVYQTKVTVSLVRLGQVEKQEEVGRSDDLAKDVEEGLTRMDSDRFPVRFILTNGSDLENEEQQIVSYPWLEKLNFFHLPKVETLAADFSIRAIALSGGAEAAKSLGLEMDGTQEKSAEPTGVLEDSLESFGFSVEQVSPEPIMELKPEIPETDSYVTNDFSGDSSTEETAEPVEESNLRDPGDGLSGRMKLKIPAIGFNHIKTTLPKISLPSFSSKFLLLIPIVILLAIPLALYLFYTFTSKADITVKITEKSISETLPVILSNTPQTDKTTIPTEYKTIDISVSNSLSTTGETLIGDKAVGSITIYNRSAESRAFKSGTKITASSGAVFSLDTAVNVASSSSELTPPFIITPGSASVNVTAVKIGAESNLSKGTQFSVDSFPKSVLIATSDSDFSKGSSRTVKAVAKEDIASLLAQANTEIETETNTQVSSSDPDQRSLVISNYEVLKKTFSATVGEEASSLSLELSVKVPILTYSHDKLVEIITRDVISKSQPGMRLLPEKTSIELEKPTKTADSVFSSTAKVTGVIVPSVNTEDYKAQILGKSVADVAQLLHTIPGIAGVIIKISPDIPLMSTNLPKNKSKITIVLSVE